MMNVREETLLPVMTSKRHGHESITAVHPPWVSPVRISILQRTTSETRPSPTQQMALAIRAPSHCRTGGKNGRTRPRFHRLQARETVEIQNLHPAIPPSRGGASGGAWQGAYRGYGLCSAYLRGADWPTSARRAAAKFVLFQERAALGLSYLGTYRDRSCLW